jgi:hypothetical protein
MRVNTAQSIRTANAVHSRFGSWRAAKEAARYEGGRFVVRAADDADPDPADASGAEDAPAGR